MAQLAGQISPFAHPLRRLPHDSQPSLFAFWHRFPTSWRWSLLREIEAKTEPTLLREAATGLELCSFFENWIP